MKTVDINGVTYIPLDDASKIIEKHKCESNNLRHAISMTFKFFAPFDENELSEDSDAYAWWRKIKQSKYAKEIVEKSRADYELTIKQQQDQINGLKSQIARIKKMNAEVLLQRNLYELKNVRDLLNDILQD